MAGTSKSTRASGAKSTAKTDADLSVEDQVELQDPEQQGGDQDSPLIVDAETAVPMTPSEEAKAPEPEPAKAPKRQSVFIPMMLGGVAAAGIGFAAARYVIPEGWPIVGAGLSQAAQDIAAQATKVQALEAQFSELAGKVDALPAADAIAGLQTTQSQTSEKLSAVETSVDAALQTLAAFDARLTAVETRPVVGAGGDISGTALATYQRELADLRASLEAQRAENDAMAANISAVADKARAQIAEAQQQAATKTEAATSRAALSRVLASLESGSGYSAALSDLASSGVAIPSVLTENAESGVATIAELQRRFPDLARKALDASIKATVGSGAMDKLSAFLRSQVGGRSLAPREGNDPDAVLSRAEAALQNGSLEEALTELEALPDAGREIMAPWMASAKSRVETLAAADALTQSLNQN